eukprot:TRINITY_DN15500_c0_g1_i1.p1 TRINITY_DN15500_c0_g1~~TRINITY_DN15500_c0_g1_i1.p1  ORF type:complete len:216 (-),score=59.97 TRINITY_DN15500_c0_g1_i1:137-784(-)
MKTNNTNKEINGEETTQLMQETIKRFELRIEYLDRRIENMHKEIINMKQKMETTKNGNFKENYKKRALTMLKRKKLYEKQRERLIQQQFNIESLLITTDTMRDNVISAQLIKEAQDHLKNEMHHLDSENIHHMQDQIDEMMLSNYEIHDSLSRSYDLPNDVDENEIDLEFDRLVEDLSDEEEIPSYLQTLPNAPSTSFKTNNEKESHHFNENLHL